MTVECCRHSKDILKCGILIYHNSNIISDIINPSGIKKELSIYHKAYEVCLKEKIHKNGIFFLITIIGNHNFNKLYAH